MTTNLLAAIVVTLSTNTVERVTGYLRQVPDVCPEGRSGCAVMHWKGVDPNEKTITTTAKHTTTLSFDWMGKTQAVEHVEVLWESNKVVRLEWLEVPSAGWPTNINSWGHVITTNMLFTVPDPTWIIK